MLMTQSSSTAADAGGSVSTPSSSFSQSPLILEVIVGRTQFRNRPVHGPRFLIGAGAECDLRLGGDQMPSLHSLITIEGNEICLEAISDTPAMLINGRRQTSVLLSEGDVIRLGSVEMVARIPRQSESPHRLPVSVPESDESEPKLEDLSAMELINLIEREEAEVAAFEGRRQLGGAGLLDAVRSRRPTRSARTVPHPGAIGGVPAPHIGPVQPKIAAHSRSASLSEQGRLRTDDGLLKDLEGMGRSLSLFSSELKQRALTASEREAGYASAVTLLLETQQKLVSQVELLLIQVSALRNAPSKPELRTRASA